jgi:hypothetical protein
MDELIDQYKEAVAELLRLTQLETRTKIQVQKARHNLNAIKSELRVKEMEMMEIKMEDTN